MPADRLRFGNENNVQFRSKSKRLKYTIRYKSVANKSFRAAYHVADFWFLRPSWRSHQNLYRHKKRPKHLLKRLQIHWEEKVASYSYQQKKHRQQSQIKSRQL